MGMHALTSIYDALQHKSVVSGLALPFVPLHNQLRLGLLQLLLDVRLHGPDLGLQAVDLPVALFPLLYELLSVLLKLAFQATVLA